MHWNKIDEICAQMMHIPFNDFEPFYNTETNEWNIISWWNCIFLINQFKKHVEDLTESTSMDVNIVRTSNMTHYASILNIEWIKHLYDPCLRLSSPVRT